MNYLNCNNELIQTTFLQLLSVGNQNTITQIIYILSQQLDHISSSKLRQFERENERIYLDWTNDSILWLKNLFPEKVRFKLRDCFSYK
jgi:hypothetical protein